MNLVIDIGNSRIKYAHFDGQEMTYFEVVSKRSIKKIYASIRNLKVDHVIIAHSGKLDERLLESFRDYPLLVLDQDTPLPIAIEINHPHTIGRDRLASAIGARLRSPDDATLIIDMGTCITMNIVSNEGVFIGGNISPGLKMRLKAMHHFTAKLPMVEVEVPNDIIGTDTKTALQNGGLRGAFYEIETFIDLMKARYDVKSIFLTGGDASYFEEFTNNAIFARPYLVLEGLNEILNYNAKKK